MEKRNLTSSAIVTNMIRIGIGENASHDSVDDKFYTTTLSGLLKNG